MPSCETYVMTGQAHSDAQFWQGALGTLVHYCLMYFVISDMNISLNIKGHVFNLGLGVDVCLSEVEQGYVEL